MRRIPDSKDAGGEDGEGEKSLQGVEAQGLNLPAADVRAGLFFLFQERKKESFILCKAHVSVKVL